MLVYVANRQIVARPPDTTTLTTLIADPSGSNSGAAPSHLRWSPSGRKLLYTIEPTGAITQPQVAVYDFDAQHLVNLGPGRDPAWSADSDRVAFSRDGFGNEAVIVKTLTTGQEENLGLGRVPAWLPDGQHVATWRDGNIRLLAYPPGGATQLTHEPVTGPDAWYGTGLLYHASGRILFYGARARDVGASGNGMRLMSADLAGGALHEWMPGRGNGLVALDISPDARYIAVGDQAHSSACATYGGVTIVDTFTGQTTALKLPETEERHVHLMGVSWAASRPPRLAVAYSEWSCAPDKTGDLGPSRLYLVDLAAPDNLQLQGDGSWPAWNRGREGLGLPPFAGFAH
jgi:Tol biopolymer transport system component